MLQTINVDEAFVATETETAFVTEIDSQLAAYREALLSKDRGSQYFKRGSLTSKLTALSDARRLLYGVAD